MSKYKILATSFLGKPIDPKATHVIIGGGIAGLFMGYCLKQLGVKFEIIENKTKAGGILGSQKIAHGTVEQAANGFLWSPAMQALCDGLALDILPPKATANARYLVRDKQLRKFPLTVLESLAAVGKLWVSPSQPMETIYDFGIEYLGKAMANQLLEPAFAGIYGADIKKLSFPGALTPLAKILNRSDNLAWALWKHRRAQKKETIPAKGKAKRGTHSFKNGMGELVTRLTEYLSSEIVYEQNGLDWINTKEQLILCTPAYVSQHFFDADTDIAKSLGAVSYTPIVSVSLIFKKSQLKNFKPGFGCLIPRSEGLNILGTLFNSCIFDHRVAHEELLSLTCIIRDDSPNLAYFQQTDAEVTDWVVAELDQLFGISGAPESATIFKWQKGIPLYTPELYHNWFDWDRSLKENYPRRNLFGNYTGEISIRGMCETMMAMIP